MDDSLSLSLLAILFLIACSAFFSGSETALTGISRARIFHLVTEGSKRAALVLRLREQKELLIGTILLGNTLVNILGSAIATAYAIRHFGESAGPIYAAVAMTVAVLIFGEVLPKTIAIQRAESFALGVAPMVNWLIRLLSPITITLKWIIDMLLRLMRLHGQSGEDFNAFDVLRGSIEMQAQAGGIVKHDRDMLSSILDLDEVPLEDIMVHRKQVEMIDFDQPVDAIIEQATTSPHTRLPIYQGDQDDVIGVLHGKSLLRLLRNHSGEITHQEIRDLIPPAWFVPATTSLKEQLMAFRQQRQHFAFVVDEYGAWLGIVTLEDILEEIVGDIDDEHDHQANPDIMAAGDHVWEVEGGVTLRELNRALDWDLPDEHASTIAGLVIHTARRIPEPNETFMLEDGVEAKVLGREGTQLTRLRLTRALPEPSDV